MIFMAFFERCFIQVCFFFILYFQLFRLPFTPLHNGKLFLWLAKNTHWWIPLCHTLCKAKLPEISLQCVIVLLDKEVKLIVNAGWFSQYLTRSWTFFFFLTMSDFRFSLLPQSLCFKFFHILWNDQVNSFNLYQGYILPSTVSMVSSSM